MQFTFKGYTVDELYKFHGHQFMAVIKGNTVVGEVFVGFERVYLLSNCDELSGHNFIIDKEETPDWKYNWVIYDEYQKEGYSYNKEELFEIFAITKEKQEVTVSWKLYVKQISDKHIDISATSGQMVCTITEQGIYLYSSANPSDIKGKNYEKVEGMFGTGGRLKVHLL